MRRSGIMVAAILVAMMLVSISVADVISPITSPKYSADRVDKIPSLDDARANNVSGPGLVATSSELNEIVGDTVYVGFSYWESQHNGTVGRMIAYNADDPDGPTIHMVWTALETDAADGAGPRHVRYNRIVDTGSGFTLEDTQGPGYVVDSGARAGYTTLAYDEATGNTYPAYHVRYGNDDYVTGLAAELFFLPGVFNEASVPNNDAVGNPTIWPKASFGNYEGTGYLHSASTESPPESASPVEPQGFTVSRSEFVSDHFEVEESAANTFALDYGMNIGVDIAVSSDGGRVAVAAPMTRDLIVHGPVPDDTSQVNNDIYLWISEDGGASWDWDSYINVTNFIDPDPGLLPDSVAAQKDTLRAYTDCNVYFDSDDVLHVAFTAAGFEYYGSSDGFTAYLTSHIYHWDEVTDEYHRIVDGTFWNYSTPGSWQRQVNRPSMYQDPETGILWCVYQQYGMEGEYQSIWDEEAQDSLYGPWDASDQFISNGEIMVSASPADANYYGRLWSKGVCITITRPDGPPEERLMEPGECRSEREPSVALNNDGDYLHISYVLDLDAGFWIQDHSDGSPEGEATWNPIIYHRVAKTELLDLMEAQGEWVEGHPMHVDGTGHWDDPMGWAWESAGGFFRSGGVDPTQNTSIAAGRFELVSMFVAPSDLDAASVFGSLSDLQIAKTDAGTFYWPAMGINTIGNCDVAEGYQVFSAEAGTWSMTGQYVNEGMTFNLSTNQWNYLGYPFHNQNIDPTVALADIADELAIIQNDDGLFWWPALGIQTLTAMTPGEGYKIFVNNDVSFTYNTGAARYAGDTFTFANNPPSGSPKSTGIPYIVAVELSDAVMAMNPVIVEAYDGNLLVGKAYVQNKKNLAAVVTWGASEEHGLEGFTAGNPITLKAVTSTGYTLTTQLEGDAPIFGEGFAARTTLTTTELPTDFEVGAAYPNPFNPTVSMSVALPTAGQVDVTVYNLLGQVVHTQALTLEAGRHNYTFNAHSAGAMASGVYFLQMQYDNQISTQKIVLMK